MKMSRHNEEEEQMDILDDEEISRVLLEADREYYGPKPPVDRQRVTANMHRLHRLLEAQVRDCEAVRENAR